MSSEDLNRQIPDELFQKVSAKPERALPDALFGPPAGQEQGEDTEHLEDTDGGDVRKAV
ncbi:hypothetical protein [Nocardia sp. NPDC024068]|uniref:hypothetical protein n=1 Tax=Nocardia sp. NPDC024068 TaxID=3157197 RepID=UPI0033D1E769